MRTSLWLGVAEDDSCESDAATALQLQEDEEYEELLKGQLQVLDEEDGELARQDEKLLQPDEDVTDA